MKKKRMGELPSSFFAHSTDPLFRKKFQGSGSFSKGQNPSADNEWKLSDIEKERFLILPRMRE